jgi:CRP/FNR family transcriptional regulator, dissimilatory nitrate respiration regulator
MASLSRLGMELLRQSIPFSNTMNFLDLKQLPPDLRSVVTYQDLSQGTHLFYQNDAVHSIFAVLSGRIRLLFYTDEGQSIDQYRVHAGEFFAEVALFKDVYGCNAIAEEPTRVIVFPKVEFWRSLQQDYALFTAFMRQLTHQLHLTKVMLEIRGMRATRERVLHYLRFMADPTTRTVRLEQSLKRTAQSLGNSPEGFSRTLKQLQAEGMITRTKRIITLHEPYDQIR